MLLIRERLHQFSNTVMRSRHGLWFEGGLVVPRHNNILAALRKPEGLFMYAAHNIVTAAGDVWYAQKAMAETPTNGFNRHAMASARTGAWTKTGATSQYGNATVIAGSSKANDSGYPRTADPDVDNTGDAVDVMTHRVSYTTTDFNGTIVAGLFHDSTQTVSASPLLTGYDFSSFTKEATDTLKVFVNHDITGS